MVTVSLVKGQKRKDTIKKSLDIISEDINKGLKAGQVIINPSFVSTSIQLAASHVDQIRGILDYSKEFCDKQITIAEMDGLPGYENTGLPFSSENMGKMHV